jgi:hypothetical protein
MVREDRRSRRGLLTVFGRGTRAVSISNPSGNFLIPLFLAPAPEEANNGHCHVVTANAAGLGVGGQAVVHHVLADLVQVLFGSNTPADKLDNSLRGLAIPDA